MSHLPGTPDRTLLRPRRRVAGVFRAFAAAVILLSAVVVFPIVVFPIVTDSASGAAATTTPSPSPLAVSDPVIGPVIGPVIESPKTGELAGGIISFAGSAEPLSAIELFANEDGQSLCSVSASPAGQWSCDVSLESSQFVTIRAVQSLAGDVRDSTVQIAVLNAPTAVAGGGGPVSSGTVTGTGLPEAEVTAVVGDVSCAAVVDATGSWFCFLPKGISSGDYSLTASQIASWSGGRASASSSPITVTIDIDAPVPPGVTVPAGSSIPTVGALFEGSGEDGATVTVFAGPHTLCQAVVSGGRWSCTATAIDVGSYDVSAIQQDAAGNISAASASTRVAFGAGGSAVPVAPEAPPTPKPTTTRGPSPSPTASAAPSASALPSAGSPDIVAPRAADGQVQATPLLPGAVTPGSWSAATRFSGSMQSAFGQTGSINWTLSLSIGLAILALLAVPTRLLAGALRTLGGPSSSPVRPSRFTGRNRSRHEEFETAPTLPWSNRITGVFALLAAAAVTVLSAPVDDQPAYLRLLGAVTLGILLVNVVAVVVPRLLSRWILDADVKVRLRPIFLVISVGATLLSRALDLDPALVFGLVFALGLADVTTRRLRGRMAAAQVAGLIVVGTTALLLSGSLPAAGTIAGAFLSEFTNTVTLAAVGAAAILLLPVGDLPGRHILRWRPLVWLALGIVGFTLLGGLVSTSLGGLGGGAGIILFALASLTFAGVCVATWIWARFVHQPSGDQVARNRGDGCLSEQSVHQEVTSEPRDEPRPEVEKTR